MAGKKGNGNQNQPKRRGRPPGSKNKKKSKVDTVKRGRKSLSSNSVEVTVREILKMSATPEVKLRLIEAAIGIN